MGTSHSRFPPTEATSLSLLKPLQLRPLPLEVHSKILLRRSRLLFACPTQNCPFFCTPSRLTSAEKSHPSRGKIAKKSFRKQCHVCTCPSPTGDCQGPTAVSTTTTCLRDEQAFPLWFNPFRVYESAFKLHLNRSA